MKQLSNGLSRAQQRELINNYLISCIDTDVMSDIETMISTPKEKVNFVMFCFNEEYNHDYNKRLYPNEITRFSEWLKGLPSVFNIAFSYCDILELAEQWGADVSTEGKKDRICENWFNYIANKFYQLHTKLNK